MLTQAFLKKYENKEVPWGEVGYPTYKRTYARKHGKRTEEWHETIFRSVNGLVEIGGRFTTSELEQLFDVMFHLKGTCSGRALWQLGSSTVKKIGSDSMQNCWHVAMKDVEAFCFTFNQLMLGGGVGFNIMPENVYSLPTVHTNVEVNRVETYDCDFIVPDNREGWVELLRKVLTAFLITGKPLTFCTRAIRPAGMPILSFGGTASGSEMLVQGMMSIVAILKSRAGRKLRPIDVLDIQNIIGMIVVAGNVRRSAQIACGDPRDLAFLRAKDWTRSKIPNWRVQSNNSVMAEHYEELVQEFWEPYLTEGECYGLINPYTCRNYGRLADGYRYRTDDKFVGVNPCGEITLEDKEPCNLADIYMPNLENEDEFKHVAELLYKVTKTISCINFSDPATQEVVHRNHRLGIGLTGFVEATHLHDSEIFNRVYRHIEQTDVRFSKELGVPESNKLTTIKPSGTLSLLAGVTPGAHDGYSQFVIRRIRMSAGDPLVDLCRDSGYHVEPLLRLDGSRDHGTMVVEFPCRYKSNIKAQGDVNAIEQLERQKWLQTYWADNSVSITVYYDQKEMPVIQKWLEDNYDEGVKCTSFLRHSGHGFKQAPFEPIDETTYWELKGGTLPITRLHTGDDDELTLADSLECGSGGCPVR